MILVCGEALIDLFACAGQQRGYQLTASVGGSSLNVASAARRMGIPTAFLGGISTDHFGRALMETLRAENIDTTFVKRTSGL
jgi:fructokinase